MHTGPLSFPTTPQPYTNAAIVLEFITQQFFTQVARQRPIHDFDHTGSFCACNYAGHSNARALQHEPVPIVRGWTFEACVRYPPSAWHAGCERAHDEGDGSADPPWRSLCHWNPTTCITRYRDSKTSEKEANESYCKAMVTSDEA